MLTKIFIKNFNPSIFFAVNILAHRTQPFFIFYKESYVFFVGLLLMIIINKIIQILFISLFHLHFVISISCKFTFEFLMINIIVLPKDCLSVENWCFILWISVRWITLDFGLLLEFVLIIYLNFSPFLLLIHFQNIIFEY